MTKSMRYRTAGAAAMAAMLMAGAAAAGETTRVSVASDGTQGNFESLLPVISANGRFVAFHSSASNLIAGDTNDTLDVFVHDRKTGETTRVSVASDGTEANNESAWAAISRDGRFVAFRSLASNLVAGDTNDAWDIFVHDRQTGDTTRVSVASGGEQANGDSLFNPISGEGRLVAFVSFASNLVDGDTNGTWDVFVHDRQTGETTRVSVSSSGEQGNEWTASAAISEDGRFVAFESAASNLVPVDTNFWDIFVHDRLTGETTLVSVTSDGTQPNGDNGFPSISGDGRFVAFTSFAPDLVPGDTNDVEDNFVHDRQTGETTRVSVASNGRQANGGSDYPTISENGRFIAFPSWADNLVARDTNGTRDAFVHDRQSGKTTRVNVSSNGKQANSMSEQPAISGDGRFVAFISFASNLVPGDTNGAYDIFVRNLRQLCPGPRP